MIPYSKDENEYIQFKLKYLNKIKDINEDLNKLSERNKTRILFELRNILPYAIFNLEQEINKRK